MSELLPCPFCGGEAHMESKHYGDTHYWRVWCQTPFCAFMSVAPTEQQAIEAWNTRAERTCHIKMVEVGWWECDKCGGGIDWDSYDEDDPPNCVYCPNCGAKVMK